VLRLRSAMASTLRVFPTPAALRVPGVLGRGFRCAGVPVLRRSCDGFRSVRCSADDSAVESPAREENKDVAVHAELSPPSSHLNAQDNDPLADQYGGWYGAEEEEKNTLKIGKLPTTDSPSASHSSSCAFRVTPKLNDRLQLPNPIELVISLGLRTQWSRDLVGQCSGFSFDGIRLLLHA
jgi:hypothetical protein